MRSEREVNGRNQDLAAVRPRQSPRDSRGSGLCGHAFDPFCAECGGREWIREVLCFVRYLDAGEFHDADGVRGLAVIGQDEFGDPKIAAADDSPDGKPFIARLAGALALNVAAAAGALARLRVIEHRVLVIDEVLGHKSLASDAAQC